MSYKIIKNTKPTAEEAIPALDINLYQKKSEEPKSLDGENEIKKEDPIDVLKRETRNKIVEEFEVEKREIIEKAQFELEEERKGVLEEAMLNGYEDGLISGREEGYKEYEDERARALEIITQAEDEVREYTEDTEERIIRLAGKIAEKIVHEVIDGREDSIMSIARPVLEEYGKAESVILTCNPAKVEILRAYLPEIKEICPHARVMIIQDKGLKERDIKIENESQIIDLSIKKQIKRFIELATA